MFEGWQKYAQPRRVGRHKPAHRTGVVPKPELVQAGFGVAFFGGWPILLSQSPFPVPRLWVPHPCVLCKGGYTDYEPLEILICLHIGDWPIYPHSWRHAPQGNRLPHSSRFSTSAHPQRPQLSAAILTSRDRSHPHPRLLRFDDWGIEMPSTIPFQQLKPSHCT
jgi:hypothetical protein